MLSHVLSRTCGTFDSRSHQQRDFINPGGHVGGTRQPQVFKSQRKQPDQDTSPRLPQPRSALTPQSIAQQPSADQSQDVDWTGLPGDPLSGVEPDYLHRNWGLHGLPKEPADLHCTTEKALNTVAGLHYKILDACPLSVPFSSFSYSFREIVTK